MPRFRSTQPPERQADSVIARLVDSGALRRNPARPPSVRTVANYRDCLLQVARRIASGGKELRDLDANTAVDHLRTRVDDLGQKALDLHRQALQAMLVHVTGHLPQGQRLTVVRSHRPKRRGGRAYTPQQVRLVAAAQNARNGLSTLIAHAVGLRAHELFTLARPDEQPPDPRPARPEKFAGRPGREYTVIGKGGLVRIVRLPEHLAERLEARRHDQPVQVVDRGIRYRSRYDIAGCVSWSVSFGSASKRKLGWTRGAHGNRHSYAQERMRELQRLLVRAEALEVVSQELGHFRPEITETYLR